MSRKLIFRGIVLVVVLGAAYRMFMSQPEYSLNHVTGQTMGTIQYNVKYLGEDVPNYKRAIDSILIAFNQSLSTYIPNSEISRLNTTGSLVNPSETFMDVLNQSKFIYEATDGAFDPTVGPLVSAWGFGADRKPTIPDSLAVDSLRQIVGFNKMVIESNVSMDSSMYLDFSAIAKGYAVDLVAEFLEGKGFENYMVEIGGEVRAKGQNDQNEIWKIGIEDPLVAIDEQRLLAIVQLKDRAMATSGNYRNYYQVGERTIAHTIDPRTGYNTTHNLLSASVFAYDCMTADAYATAFMVLGVEGAKEVAANSNLDIFLTYTDQKGDLRSFVSEGVQPYLEMNKLSAD
ncbi:FAD:protein FMN transferase [Marinoscillum sp.]|uniref:FAD:protein FMN transferase n=1 Tax=Marinoscillum sp. TaxID=2024838 RepID=UPI003BAC7319